MDEDRSQQQPTPDSEQPVAYDSEGRPLYYHPPREVPPAAADSAEQPVAPDDGLTVSENDTRQYVHFRRSLAPEKPEIPPEVQRRHTQSVKAYPQLNLSEGEYIIRALNRHPIGMVFPVIVGLALILLVGAALTSLPVLTDTIGLERSAYGAIFIIGLLLMVLFGIGVSVSVWVYMNNRFFLTNESVIQEIQTSLFSRHEQTVSLGNIEDASYQQLGIAAHIFNYGLIRLSTEGDETTYRFNYASKPKEQIAILNNAVEAFKNGRPIEEPNPEDD